MVVKPRGQTMRSFALSIAFLAVSAPALADTLTVDVDQSRVIRTSAPITGVVVGNAAIADVIVHDNRMLFLMGKSPGLTQVLAVDAAGRTVLSTTIRVLQADDEGIVTVNKGGKTESYYCSPRCAPAGMPGDSADALKDAAAKLGARTSVTSGANQ
jgi:hypothetical protein